MSVQYTRGCAVHRGTFSTSGDVQYTGRISLSRPGGVQYTGDTMSAQGDTMMSVGRYHEYTGGVQYSGVSI